MNITLTPCELKFGILGIQYLQNEVTSYLSRTFLTKITLTKTKCNMHKDGMKQEFMKWILYRDKPLYVESILPNWTEILGPPHSETASAPATAIISAHETDKCTKR